MIDSRRGGRARLKASDSKSDRGPEGPSGVQILSPPPFPSPPREVGGYRGSATPPDVNRRGDRAAEGAALEMPCTGLTPVPWVQIPPPPPLLGAHVCGTLGRDRARWGVSGAL